MSRNGLIQDSNKLKQEIFIFWKCTCSANKILLIRHAFLSSPVAPQKRCKNCYKIFLTEIIVRTPISFCLH